MRKNLKIVCSECGRLNQNIRAVVKVNTAFSCGNCGNKLLCIKPEDDKETVFVNVMLHDEEITGMIDGANVVHKPKKGDFFGDE